MAVIPVMTRANFGDLFGTNQLPVLEEMFRAAFSLFPPVHEQIFAKRQTTKDIYQTSERHDLPQFSQVPEGQEFPFVAQKQGGSKTLTIQKFGLGVSISQEMVEDGKFDEIGQIMTELGRSAAETREIQAMDVINNGFGSETVADGQPLFDAAHTLPSGGTFRNELVTPADLDVTSLETALTDFETEPVSDSGKQLLLRATVLLVHSSNKRLAKELIGSELKPNTSDNNMNSFKEEGLRVVHSPHLTDSDAWFLLSESSNTGLRVVQRIGVETKAGGPDSGFTTDAILFKSRYRWQVGAIHPYGAYGSPGA